MENKKPYITDKDEFKKTKDFDERFKSKENSGSLLYNIIGTTTNKVFSDAGFKEITEPTSYYATGKPYGFGIHEDMFKVRLAGKTGSLIEKQIILGGKRLHSEINVTKRGDVLTIVYKTPEAAFFRGIKPEDKNKKTYLLKEKIVVNLKSKEKVKKELTKIFTEFAEKELAYILDTKIGVEDKVDAGTTSIVNENTKTLENMKNLTLKEFFSEEEKFKSIPDEKENIDKVKDLNTITIDEKDPNKKLLFDDEEENDNKEMVEMEEKYSHLSKDEVRSLFKKTMFDKFQTTKLEELTPVEKKDLFMTIDNLVKSKQEEQLDEITTTGPTVTGSAGGFKDGAFSGSGGYNTPKAFKNTGMLKKSIKGKENKKATAKTPAEAGAPYIVSAVQEGKDVDTFEKEVIIEAHKKLMKTNYAKNKTNKRPEVDKNYNVIQKENKDPFWTTVNIDPNTHPLGLPFVKPNSPEEDNISKYGDPNKLKRIGLEETDLQRKERLIKKKFFSEAENKNEKINKRYLVTEKTTQEYEQERWKKLSLFKIYETINNEVDLYGDNKLLENNEENVNQEIIDNDLEQNVDNMIKEEVIMVQKPNSKFGLSHKFYKKDFLDENKKYILDLNTMVFIPNPNSKTI